MECPNCKANLQAGAPPAPKRLAPGPKGGLLLGSLRRWRKDELGFLAESVRDFGDLFSLRLGPGPAHFIARPEHVQYVLNDNHRNFVKQTLFWKKLRLCLGNGLLTSDGPLWLRQRRIAQPAFHRQRIAAFGGVMSRAAQDLLARWEPLRDSGKPVDIGSEMMRLTLRIVGETLLGADVTSEAESVGAAVGVVQRETIERVANPLLHLPLAVPTTRNRSYRRALATLDKIVLDIIRRRRQSKGAEGDLLSMLMDAQDEETGERMDDRQLRDEAMTVFVAGHETTATALTWTWYLLSKHPAAFRRLRAELVEVLGGRAPGMEDLPRLTYTLMVIKEAMRLYPPVWIFTRTVAQDDEIGGFHIPAKSTIMISPYITHRHPAFWENPEGFDPERFLPERFDSLPRYAYFPFGGGPRQCIGNNFAMMELQLVVATIAQSCRLDLAPHHPVAPEPAITLRPRHGMLMTIAA